MERKYFKALNFDLDTHQLKEHYPGANYRQAYDDLRRFFKRHRFSHRQGSGYISHDKRMNDCLPPILFSAIFKLLKVLPDTELDAC